MKLIKNQDFGRINKGPVVLAMGSFDGFHLGHQLIIKKTIEMASKMHLQSGVYSFYPHPLKVINPISAPSSLISREQKLKLLEEFGIDYYFEQKFTLIFSRMKFVRFIKDILVDKLKVAHIVVGKDFRFGHQGEGDIEILNNLGNKYGFTVSGLDAVQKKGEKISSTKIREMIQQGYIKDIPEYLGRYYIFDGTVIHGEGRGKKIGIPTANLKLTADYTLPPIGVYASYVYIKGKKYKSIVNFGYKPTFGGKKYSIECHILNYSDNLYGTCLSVELIDFIRDEITFSSSDALIEQINKDILYTDNHLCYNY
jgi:riboflavin kinase / FMN adenylyltransferase